MTPPKFVGGAERARRQAQSQGWEPPSQKRRRLQQQQQHHSRRHRTKRGSRRKTFEHHIGVVTLSTRKLRSSERFFAALLEAPNFPRWKPTTTTSFGDKDPADCYDKATPFRRSALETICLKLGLGPGLLPSSSRSYHQREHGSQAKIQNFLPHTDDPRGFFASRAVLVIEEARYVLEEALHKQQPQNCTNPGGSNQQRNQRQYPTHAKSKRRRPSHSEGSWMTVGLDSIDLDQKRTGFLRLGLSKVSGRFSLDELSQQRPGSCFAIEALSFRDETPQTTANNTPTTQSRDRAVMLGTVAPGKPGTSKLVLVVYERASIDRVLLLLGGPQLERDPQNDPHADTEENSNSNTNSYAPNACASEMKVRWKIRFCVTLISHCRQFEACDFGSADHHRRGGRGGLLQKIMGQKEATHIRFCYSDDDKDDVSDDGAAENDACIEEGEEEIVGYVTEESDGGEEGEEYDQADYDNNDGDPDGTQKQQHSKLHLTMSSFTGLKALNPTQEKAADKFCSSDESKATLELIQGPPGTGKTTFVVSVLARLLCQARGRGKRNRRILVTAPTNKAVAVIAKRFLESCPGLLDQYGIPVAMIGVEDKLLEPNDDGTVDEGLKRIFCYTWLDSLAEEYGRLLEELALETIESNAYRRESTPEAAPKTLMGNRALSPWLSRAFPSSGSNTFMVDDDSDTDTEDERESGNHHRRGPTATPENGRVSVIAKAKGLHVRLLRNLPRWSEASGAANLSRKILGFLGDGDVNISAASAYTKALMKVLMNKSKDDSHDSDEDERGVKTADVVPELLASALVVFCTLSTAGTSLMKRTRRIDDWIVDEAAAATEPELLIPLHLDPKRLLVVGDPKQLPATVSSPRSEQWGLGRSLHERLTVDLGRSQTMLDVQYRMKPQIAEFPSHQFYNGKLINGENVRKKSYGSSQSYTGSKSSSGDLLERTPPFCFFQVNGKEQQSHTGSYYNTEEAYALVALLKMIRGRRHRRREDSPSWCSPDRIRVITFYSAQVVTLQQILRREGLRGVLVATVDSSQGCEADMVVLSFVRTTGAGFLKDDRRMNVALTRAKHKLVCLGNATESSWATDRSAGYSSGTLTNLLREARSRGCLSLSLSKKKENGRSNTVLGVERS